MASLLSDALAGGGDQQCLVRSVLGLHGARRVGERKVRSELIAAARELVWDEQERPPPHVNRGQTM
jgi:hypothetical protein